MQSKLNELLADLTSALAEVERDMGDTTLSHSDQQLLDQAWEYYTEQIHSVEEMLANLMEDDRVGCEACSGCAYCDEAFGYDPSGEI